MAVGLLEGYGVASFGLGGVAVILEEAGAGGGNGLFGFQVISLALCHWIRYSVHF